MGTSEQGGIVTTSRARSRVSDIENEGAASDCGRLAHMEIRGQ